MDIQAALLVVLVTTGSGADSAPKIHTYIEQVMSDEACQDYVSKHDFNKEVGPVKTYADRSVMMAQYSCAKVDESTLKWLNENASK